MTLLKVLLAFIVCTLYFMVVHETISDTCKHAFYVFDGLWFLTPLSAIFQWWTVLLVEGTGLPRENHGLVTSH